MRLDQAIARAKETGVRFRRPVEAGDPSGDALSVPLDWILATDWFTEDGHVPPDPLAEARDEIERLRDALSLAEGDNAHLAGLLGEASKWVHADYGGETAEEERRVRSLQDRISAALGPHGGGDE